MQVSMEKQLAGNAVFKRISRTLLCRLFLFFVLATAGCNDETIRSTFVQMPPKIDAELSEWQQLPVTVFDNRKVALGVANDGQYLYIAGRCADRENINMIERRGLTFWIDPADRKSKDLELHFPASRYSEPNPSRGGFGKP